MTRLEVKRNRRKRNFIATVYHNSSGVCSKCGQQIRGKETEANYWNIIDKDSQKVAQLLIDLYLEGIPIVEAYRIFNERVNKKDWLGF